MIKVTKTYKDFDNNSRTEDFWFNFTEAEVTELQLSTNGGLSEMINQLVQTQDMPRIIAIFKDLVLKAYGEKSLDGRRFIKNDEIRDAFAQTQAYSDIFMELARDAKKAADFFNGVIPHVEGSTQTAVNN